MAILEQLLKELQQVKHTSPDGTPVGPMLHGPGGLFGVSGLERDVISSRVAAEGLASTLPARGSVTKYPLFPYITGKTAATGNQPDNECDDAPVAGNLKTCLQTAQFGIYQFRTRELNINEVGAIVDAGETTDLRFVNDPLVQTLGSIFPNIDDAESALELGREVLVRFVEVGMEFQDELSRQIYVGTGTGNEFAGLEVLVVEDHYDAQTGVVCDALRSDVRDFADEDISGVAGGQNIVATLVSMYREAKHNARVMRFGNTRWAFVMREQMFIELTDIWPCLYMTYRCQPENSNVSINVDTNAQLQLRMTMRDGNYLMIDNDRVAVILDDFMPEDDLGENLFSSDIYLLPLVVRGNREVLYWEYFDYSRGTSRAIRDGRLTTDFWTDGGRYLWHKQPPKNWCTTWQVKIEPRIRLEVPMLAGRLQNVAVTLDKHWRNPGPSGGSVDYVLNGGNSTGRAIPNLYSSWNPPD